jgi:hypothetical protein
MSGAISSTLAECRSRILRISTSFLPVQVGASIVEEEPKHREECKPNKYYYIFDCSRISLASRGVAKTPELEMPAV